MAIEQVRVGQDNFSYIIHCGRTGKAAVVDPGYGADKLLEMVRRMGSSLEYVINTHHHADHMSGNGRMKAATGALIVAYRGNEGGSPAPGYVDRKVDDGEVIMVGDVRLEFIHTPGHTPDGICIVVDDGALITGDTLFIDDCGRCDLPGGSVERMFSSLRRIRSLPDHLVVYPGHDYGPRPHDELGSQKSTNMTLLAGSMDELARLP